MSVLMPYKSPEERYGKINADMSVNSFRDTPQEFFAKRKANEVNRSY